MDFDYVADNEDQIYRDMLEEEQREKSIRGENNSKDYDDEGSYDE